MDLKSFCEHLNQRFEQLKRIRSRKERCFLERQIQQNETRIRCDGCCKKECALHDIRAEQIRQHLIQDRGYPQRRANFLVGRWRETGRCYAPD